MDLITAKIVVLFLLGIIKLSSGLAPLILSRCVKSNELSWMNKIMAAMMCVGGGVLLSTVFIHMLPEVSIKFKDKVYYRSFERYLIRKTNDYFRFVKI